MKNKVGKLFGIALIIFCAGLAYVVLSLNSYSKDIECKRDFNTGWSYEDEDGNDVNIAHIPYKIKWEKGKVLKIKNKLPEIQDTEDSLIMLSHYQSVRILIDGRIVYEYSGNINSTFKTPGCKWNFITLNKEDSGKDVVIELSSEYSASVGEITGIYIGNGRKFIIDDIRENIVSLIICEVCIIIGVTLIIIHIYLLIKHRQKYGFLYLGFFTIFISIWAWCETRCTYLLMNNTEIAIVLICSGLMIAPVAALLFFRDSLLVDKKTPRLIINIFAAVFTINYIVQMILHILGIINFQEFMSIYLAIIIITFLIVFIIAVWDMRVNKSHDAKILILSEIILMITGIIDVIRYYKDMTGDCAKYTRFGLCIFLLIMTFNYGIKIYNLSAKGKEAAIYEKLAYEDALTKCKNRAFFQKEINNTWENVNRYEYVAIVTFDLNYLKYNNDNFGHQVGDRLIHTCAACISEAFMSRGVCCRIGGDEFAMVLREQCEENIKQSIEALHEKIDFYNRNSLYKVSVSYGYAMYDSKRDKDLEAVLIRADKEMYKCKKSMKEKSEITNENI